MVYYLSIYAKSCIFERMKDIMKYENVKCPYCEKKFTEDSDIVVCPECGTPHHRDCYLDNGACANERKHFDGFEWKNPSAQKAQSLPEELKYDRQREEEQSPNGAVPAVEVGPDGMPRPVFRIIRGSEKIGEHTVEEFGEVIVKNNRRYIPKFLMLQKTGSKLSVNWAAFLFGPLWLLYRKMYAYAAAVMILVSFFPLLFIGDTVKYSTALQKAYYDTAQLSLQSADITEEELMQQSKKIADELPEKPKAMVLSSLVEISSCVVLGLFGNYIYMRRCNKILKKADEDGLSGEQRKQYLSKVGGCSIAAVVLGYLVYAVVLTAAAQIYAKTGMDPGDILRRHIK